MKITVSPESVARVAASGSMPVANTPAPFAEYLRLELAKWGKISKDNNIKADYQITVCAGPDRKEPKKC